METELTELFEKAKKAADAAAAAVEAELSPEEDRCLDVLKQLERFPVNYQVLVSTQVGRRLRHLTKHPRKKIQALAVHLVEIWKNIVVEETLKKNRNGSFSPVGAETSEASKVLGLNSLKVENVEKNDSSVILRSEKLIKSETYATEKKVEAFDAVKNLGNSVGKQKEVVTIATHGKQTPEVRKPTLTTVAAPKLSNLVYCNDAVRDKIRELLSEALCRVSSEVEEHLRGKVDACDPIRVAVCLESAMFEKWGRSNGAQKVKYRSIMFNIKDSSNPDFRRKVLLGHVKPEQVLEMKPEEMASNERQLENKKIKEKALFECERGKQPEATTNSFKCGRCGKRKCTYYQLQTRSADEPMTTFVTCVNCNKRWKFC